MQIRVARHTDRLAQVTAFYRDGLGLREAGGFADHDGYDGVFLEIPGTGAHLELTTGGGHRVRVESPDAVELAGVLDAAGMEVVRRAGDELLVAGATRESIARLAMRAELLVLGLSDEADSLEDVFLDLTTTTVPEVLA